MTETKPKTYNGDLSHLPQALLPLTQEMRWLIWRWEERTTKDGEVKLTKPPFQSRYPERHARSDDATTWGSYSDAVAAVQSGVADGIGFALLGANISAIDLDHCRDPETGAIAQWAAEICEQVTKDSGYIEVTVSGTGLRVIMRDSGPELHRRIANSSAPGAGTELYRNTARYITISGLELGSCGQLPQGTLAFDEINRVISFAGWFSGIAVGPQSREQLDFNASTGKQVDYDEIIKNGVPEGQRSEMFARVVWHLAGQGHTAEKIIELLAKHPAGIAAKYANRIAAEVERLLRKRQTTKRATKTAASSTNDPWPQIQVIPGELPRVVNEAESALLLLGEEIYQKGSLLVRPTLTDLKASHNRETKGWELVQITPTYMAETLTRAAQFLRYDGRSKSWVAIDAPGRVADTYLHRRGQWRLPILTGICSTPFLREDGSLCEKAGYDPASGLLSKHDDCVFPPVLQTPNKSDAVAALAELNRLIADFPFVTESDRATALAAILTTLDRRSMPTAPLFAFSAPSAGTGKSLLADIAAVLASGHLMPVVSQGRSEEELEKRLGAALLVGSPLVSLDNCEHPLQSSFLCQALTQEVLTIRLLGLSQNVDTLVNTTCFATGNNLVIAGDLTRRTLLCSLDAHCEHPEQRQFAFDPVAVARAERGRLVVAALTILRAWHL
jgi:hypothetical protein